MARVAKAAAEKMVALLTSTTAGMNTELAELCRVENVLAPQVLASQVRSQNVAAEIAERAGEIVYPAVHVYCEKIANEMREKFRTFSGRAFLAAEVRVSQDQLEGIERKLQLCVDAVTRVLDDNRGDWGDGIFYAGGYEAVFQPVKRGGKNFAQTAKVSFELGVSN